MEVTRAIFVSLMLNNAFSCDRTHSRPQEGTISHSPSKDTLVNVRTEQADTIGDFSIDRTDSRSQEGTINHSPSKGTLVNFRTEKADTIGDFSTVKAIRHSHEPHTPVRSQTRLADTSGSISVEPTELVAHSSSLSFEQGAPLAGHSRVAGTGDLSTLSPPSSWAGSDLASSKPRTSPSESSSDFRADLRTQITREQIEDASSGLTSEPQARGCPWQTKHRSHPTPNLIEFVKQNYVQGVPEDAAGQGLGYWRWNLNMSRRPGEGQTAILKFRTKYPIESGLIKQGESGLILAVYDRRFEESHGEDLMQWHSSLTTSSRIIGFSDENKAMSGRKKPIEYRDVRAPVVGTHDKAYIILLNYPRRWVLAQPETLKDAVEKVDVAATGSAEALQFFQPFPEHKIAKIWDRAETLLSPELKDALSKGKLVRTESLPSFETGIDNQAVTMACGEGYKTFIVPLWALEPLAMSGTDVQSIQKLMDAVPE